MLFHLLLCVLETHNNSSLASYFTFSIVFAHDLFITIKQLLLFLHIVKKGCIGLLLFIAGQTTGLISTVGTI